MNCKILTLANFKGGVAKTTSAVCLAEEFAARGRKVVLVDADLQGTASQWIGAAPKDAPLRVPVMGMARAQGNLHKQLEPLVPHHDVIVVDCPPSLDAGTVRSALLVSDVCLVPMQPTPADLWATQAMVELVSVVRGTNPSLAAFALATRVGNNRIARQVLEVMRGSDLPLLSSHLRARVSFQEAAVHGSVPGRMGWAHKKAALEVTRLADEIFQRMEWQ